MCRRRHGGKGQTAAGRLIRPGPGGLRPGQPFRRKARCGWTPSASGCSRGWPRCQGTAPSSRAGGRPEHAEALGGWAQPSPPRGRAAVCPAADTRECRCALVSAAAAEGGGPDAHRGRAGGRRLRRARVAGGRPRRPNAWPGGHRPPMGTGWPLRFRSEARARSRTQRGRENARDWRAVWPGLLPVRRAVAWPSGTDCEAGTGDAARPLRRCARCLAALGRSTAPRVAVKVAWAFSGCRRPRRPARPRAPAGGRSCRGPRSRTSCCRPGAPGRIRTCDIPLRRRVLYPAELRAPGTALRPKRPRSKAGMPAGTRDSHPGPRRRAALAPSGRLQRRRRPKGSPVADARHSGADRRQGDRPGSAPCRRDAPAEPLPGRGAACAPEATRGDAPLAGRTRTGTGDARRQAGRGGSPAARPSATPAAARPAAYRKFSA